MASGLDGWSGGSRFKTCWEQMNFLLCVLQPTVNWALVSLAQRWHGPNVFSSLDQLVEGLTFPLSLPMCCIHRQDMTGKVVAGRRKAPKLIVEFELVNKVVVLHSCEPVAMHCTTNILTMITWFPSHFTSRLCCIIQVPAGTCKENGPVYDKTGLRWKKLNVLFFILNDSPTYGYH